jgi:hypothetical protein
VAIPAHTATRRSLSGGPTSSFRVLDFTDCSGFFTMIQLLCQEHRYFSIAADRIGLGPPKARPSDRVCVFRWGEVPFILRKNEVEASARYKLIGDAYVHRVMYGELADQVKWSTETFIID